MGANFNSGFTCFDHPQLPIVFPHLSFSPNPPLVLLGLNLFLLVVRFGMLLAIAPVTIALNLEVVGCFGFPHWLIP